MVPQIELSSFSDNLTDSVPLSVNNIPGIEEVNMIKDDGTVIHFNNPKVSIW